MARRLSPSYAEHKLLAAMDRGPYATQAEWAKAAGVHPITLVKALQRERFVSLYRNVLLRRAYSRAPTVLDAVIEIAERPEHTSHASQRMILEMTGLYVPRSKSEVSGNLQLDFATLIQGLASEPAVDATARELPPGESDADK